MSNRVEKIQTRTGTRHRIAKVTALLIAALTVMSARTQSQDIQSLDAYLLFYSSFDDTTDVNLFGPDNNAGWIYTAESTRRAQVLMNNRCPEVSIAAGEGKLRDCLKFSDRSKQVLFYQASPNLVLPRKNWAGTVSFWLKPEIASSAKGTCYPVQLCDGDWNHGGFFVRFLGEPLSRFEFGVVSSGDGSQTFDSPDDLPKERVLSTSVESGRIPEEEWTLVTFSFENVNPDGDHKTLSKLFLNGELAGQIQQPLQVLWMQPNALNNEHDAAIFLGIHYVGSIDELRVYRRALSETTLKRLHQEEK